MNLWEGSFLSFLFHTAIAHTIQTLQLPTTINTTRANAPGVQ
jgi:hypothetical protein